MGGLDGIDGLKSDEQQYMSGSHTDMYCNEIGTNWFNSSCSVLFKSWTGVWLPSLTSFGRHPFRGSQHPYLPCPASSVHCLWMDACQKRRGWEALNNCSAEKQASTNHQNGGSCPSLIGTHTSVAWRRKIISYSTTNFQQGEIFVSGVNRKAKPSASYKDACHIYHLILMILGYCTNPGKQGRQSTDKWLKACLPPSPIGW